MNVSDELAIELCRVDFTAAGKEQALQQMAAIAAASPVLKPYGRDRLYQLLAEREAAVSTGLGGGVAIPHARIEGLKQFVVFVLIAPKGVHFEALDQRKVNLFFVMFAPEERKAEHLRLLAAISRMLAQADLKKEMLNTRTTAALQEAIARVCVAEEAPAPAKPSGGPKKVLFIVLFYEEDLQAVLEYLIEQGVEGAVITEAKGMGAYVSAMPLFASFLGFMREDLNIAHTIMTVVDADREQAIVGGIESITGDLNKKQGAMLISLDVTLSKGTMSMI